MCPNFFMTYEMNEESTVLPCNVYHQKVIDIRLRKKIVLFPVIDVSPFGNIVVHRSRHRRSDSPFENIIYNTE